MTIWDIGVAVKKLVLSLATLLKDDAAPGFVVIALVSVLLLALIYLLLVVRARLRALRALERLISKIKDKAQFTQSVDSIEASLRKLRRSGPLNHVATAWREYRETFVPHKEAGAVIIRNSVRPSVFFNVEDLHFAAGFWRVVPGLFVTTGLFLTFLGLISALNSMGEGLNPTSTTIALGSTELSVKPDAADPPSTNAMLKTLLKLASAKFIMSLTGLACSIAFTIALRISMGRIENKIYQLCKTIEERLTFISLEALAVEQLATTREQREHFRAIGMELVAELGRPLREVREELPAAISQSITVAMSPMLQQIGQVSADGMGSMVNELSSRFSSDVGRALSQTSDRLSEAGDRLAKVSESLAKGSGQMGEQMEAAVSRLAEAVGELRNSVGETAQTATTALTAGTDSLLAMMNQTLEQIRDHTRDGAEAMSTAAGEIREAAEGFKTDISAASAEGAFAVRGHMAAAGTSASNAISGAGEAVIETFGRTAAEIVQATETLTGRATAQFLAPLEEIATQMGRMVQDIASGGEHFSQLREGIQNSAAAAERASGAIRSASQDFIAAADPLRTTADKIASNVQSLSDTTRRVGDVVLNAAQSTAQNASATLKAAQETLGGQNRAVQASLQAVEEMLRQLKGQGDRLDGIDQKLGQALEQYRTQVESTVGSLFGHVRTMQDQLAPAIDTLRSVVEQAEQFVPASKGGR
jgi:methyl-accepting chemotaxis protein